LPPMRGWAQTRGARDELAARRILIIEDDSSSVRALRDAFRAEGYDVDTVATGTAGLIRAVNWRPHLIILDLLLPDLDGFDLCRDLASRTVASIIIVSRSAEEADKVHGLEVGADDYVVKPFSMRELIARVHAALRRADGERPRLGYIRFADVAVDFDLGLVERAGAPVPCTQKEVELLRYLVMHPGRPFTRDDLLRAVWGYQVAPLTRTVDTHVARLRQKLEADPHDPRHIQTIHGTGYVFTP